MNVFVLRLTNGRFGRGGGGWIGYYHVGVVEDGCVVICDVDFDEGAGWHFTAEFISPVYWLAVVGLVKVMTVGY